MPHPFLSAAGLLVSASCLQATTADLLQPAWRGSWQATAGKEMPVKIDFDADKAWMTVSRPGGPFNPLVLATHFGKGGPLPVGASSPPEVTLENIGDTIGIRLVVTYNKDACLTAPWTPLRLAIGNSRGTRQSAQHTDVVHDVFKDDTGWSFLCGQGVTSTFLLHRPPTVNDTYKNYLITSGSSGRLVKAWTNPPPDGFFKPDEPIETIFSLTKTGPNELKFYGFVTSHEVEHTIPNVTNFTFDTLFLHFPNGKYGPNPAFTIRELQLHTPGP